MHLRQREHKQYGALAAKGEGVMDEKKTGHNEECGNEQHTNHLCYLQFEGYHYAHKPEYKALVQDAQFICQNCGRTAKSAANLCAPQAL